MGWDFNLALLGYSDAWRAHRRIVHQYFRPDAVTGYHPMLSSSVKAILKTLLDRPEDPYYQLRELVVVLSIYTTVEDSFLKIISLISFEWYSYVGSIPLKLAYDRDVKSHSDPLIQRVEKAVAMLAAVLYPGARLVNSFPSCELAVKLDGTHCAQS